VSAVDTFEWFVTTQAGPLSPRAGEFVAAQRQALYLIRSEDERQRFVEWVMAELSRIVKTGEGGARPRRGPAAVGN